MPLHVRTSRRALAAVSLAILLVGCAPRAAQVGPTTARKAPAAIGSPAMTHDGISAMLRDYDVRNNAAIDLSRRRLDPSGWAAADSGSVLRTDLFDTEYLRADKTPFQAETLVTTPRRLYAPAQRGYPRWFVLSGQVNLVGHQPTVAGRRLWVFVQRDADDPWHMDSVMDFPKDEPQAREVGTASNASDAQRDAAVDALAGVQAYLTSGVPTTVQPGAELTALYTNATAGLGPGTFLTDNVVAPLGNSEDPTGPFGAARVVAVDGGALAVLTYEYRRRYEPEPGNTIELDDEVLAAAMQQPGRRTSVTASGIVTVAVLLPDDGPARVLYADSGKTL